MLDVLHRWIQIPIFFLREKLTDRNFFIFSSILVGITSGLAAVALKYSVHTLESLVSFYAINYERFFLFALFPLLGIVLTVFFVRYLLRTQVKKGSAEIVYAIAKKSSVLPPQDNYAHLVTSALTVAFGGSVGLESPMVSTGSAIGSTYGSTYKLRYRDRTILLACGAAAGIAAAFNSPIAGVLFAVEVLLAEVSGAAFIPLIISAACGALVSKMILKEGITLSFSLQQPFNYHNVPSYILLGIVCGIIALYYARSFTWTEKKISQVKNIWVRAITGGGILFFMLLIFPPLFGEGYESIKLLAILNPQELTQASVIHGWLTNEIYILIFLGGLALLKSIAAAVTLGSGGNGGNFGPSLFVGAYLGFVFARIMNLSGLTSIPESNFTLVAMAGILSGVFYAPLTAIFLIAEITGGYELMIPLMIVSSISLFIVKVAQPQSMESKKLAEKMNVFTENKDRFLLSKLDLPELIETNFSVVHPNETLQKLIEKISRSTRNLFPVVNDQNELIGIVHLDNIRTVIFNPSHHENVTVHDLMNPVKATIETNENLHSVLQKFDSSRQWNLPVTDNKKYVGFVSKSSILSRYRNELIESA